MNFRKTFDYDPETNDVYSVLRKYMTFGKMKGGSDNRPVRIFESSSSDETSSTPSTERTESTYSRETTPETDETEETESSRSSSASTFGSVRSAFRPFQRIVDDATDSDSGSSFGSQSSAFRRYIREQGERMPKEEDEEEDLTKKEDEIKKQLVILSNEGIRINKKILENKKLMSNSRLTEEEREKLELENKELMKQSKEIKKQEGDLEFEMEKIEYMGTEDMPKFLTFSRTLPTKKRQQFLKELARKEKEINDIKKQSGIARFKLRDLKYKYNTEDDEETSRRLALEYAKEENKFKALEKLYVKKVQEYGNIPHKYMDTKDEENPSGAYELEEGEGDPRYTYLSNPTRTTELEYDPESRFATTADRGINEIDNTFKAYKMVKPEYESDFSEKSTSPSELDPRLDAIGQILEEEEKSGDVEERETKDDEDASLPFTQTVKISKRNESKMISAIINFIKLKYRTPYGILRTVNSYRDDRILAILKYNPKILEAVYNNLSRTPYKKLMENFKRLLNGERQID